MAVEVVVGILASSLALLSDAAHMLTDAGAIALAILAARLARRPAGGGFTFGMRRAEILSAQLNGATLLALGAVIVLEGVRRLVSPPDVEGGAVVVVAVAGIGGEPGRHDGPRRAPTAAASTSRAPSSTCSRTSSRSSPRPWRASVIADHGLRARGRHRRAASSRR